jgi:hypothetical protein
METYRCEGPQSPKSNDLPFEIDQMGMTREKGNWTGFFHDLKGSRDVQSVGRVIRRPGLLRISLP